MKAPEPWRDVRRLLVTRLDNLGDVILLSPALRALRAALPETAITLMASPAGSRAEPLLPWIDEVIAHRAVWQDASGAMGLDAAREQALIDDLRRRDFDGAIFFTSFSQTPYVIAYACYLAGIPLRLGQSKEFGGSVLTQWVRSLPDDVHQAERNLALLEAAGFRVERRDLELSLPHDVQRSADALLRDSNVSPDEPYIVVAPGASCAARRYDPARFAAVARQLAETLNATVVLLGSEREANLLPTLDSPRRGRVVVLIGRTSVPELAAVIRRAGLAVVNNSGPLHLADAFGVPTVVLYSGTDLVSQWRPRRSAAKLLGRPTPCTPCYGFECPYGMECLDIPPSDVVAAAVSLWPIAAKAMRQCSE